jgi:hypothetical protein
LAALAGVPGVQLISLQKGPATEQLAGLATRFAVPDLGSRLDETAGAFMDTAAVMQHLDLARRKDLPAGPARTTGRCASRNNFSKKPSPVLASSKFSNYGCVTRPR